jgi:hypothetical protein
MREKDLGTIRETDFKSKNLFGIQHACDRDLLGRTCKGTVKIKRNIILC